MGEAKRVSHSRTIHWFGALVLLAIGTVGCIVEAEPSPAPILYVPDTAGIVASVDTVGPGTRYELVDGRIISTQPGVRLPGSKNPDVGDLLLSGTQPAMWLHGARAGVPKPLPEPADCYVMIGATRANTTHVFISVHDAALGDAVIVFRKASDWKDVDYMKVEGSDVLLGVYNCINERGEATEHRIGQ